MRSATRTIFVLAFALVMALPAISSLARAGPSQPICNTARDSWSPRTGATVSITATACGTVDPSTQDFKTSSESVTSTTTDPNIVAVNASYTYFGLCSTISTCMPTDSYTYLVTTNTGAGIYPNNSQSFNAKQTNQAYCVEVNPFNLSVKDNVSGLSHNLSAVAAQPSGDPAHRTCPV